MYKQFLNVLGNGLVKTLGLGSSWVIREVECFVLRRSVPTPNKTAGDRQRGIIRQIGNMFGPSWVQKVGQTLLKMPLLKQHL